MFRLRSLSYSGRFLPLQLSEIEVAWLIDLSDVLKRPTDINDLKRNSYGEFRTTVPSDEIL